MVNALDGSSGPGPRPGQGHCFVFLGNTFLGFLKFYCYFWKAIILYKYDKCLRGWPASSCCVFGQVI